MVFLCLKCHIPLCCGKSVGGTVSFWSDTTEFTQLTEILPSYPQLPNCTAIVSNWTTPVGPTHQGAFTHCSGGQQRPLYSFPFYMAPVHLGHGRMLMFMFSHSHAQRSTLDSRWNSAEDEEIKSYSTARHDILRKRQKCHSAEWIPVQVTCSSICVTSSCVVYRLYMFFFFTSSHITYIVCTEENQRMRSHQRNPSQMAQLKFYFDYS